MFKSGIFKVATMSFDVFRENIFFRENFRTCIYSIKQLIITVGRERPFI